MPTCVRVYVYACVRAGYTIHAPFVRLFADCLTGFDPRMIDVALRERECIEYRLVRLYACICMKVLIIVYMDVSMQISMYECVCGIQASGYESYLASSKTAEVMSCNVTLRAILKQRGMCK